MEPVGTATRRCLRQERYGPPQQHRTWQVRLVHEASHTPSEPPAQGQEIVNFRMDVESTVRSMY